MKQADFAHEVKIHMVPMTHAPEGMLAVSVLEPRTLTNILRPSIVFYWDNTTEQPEPGEAFEADLDAVIARAFEGYRVTSLLGGVLEVHDDLGLITREEVFFTIAPKGNP